MFPKRKRWIQVSKAEALDSCSHNGVQRFSFVSPSKIVVGGTPLWLPIQKKRPPILSNQVFRSLARFFVNNIFII